MNEKEKLKLLRGYLKKTVGFTLENSTKLKKKHIWLFSINNLNPKEKTKKKKQIGAQTKQERNNSNVSNQVFQEMRKYLEPGKLEMTLPWQQKQQQQQQRDREKAITFTVSPVR